MNLHESGPIAATLGHLVTNSLRPLFVGEPNSRDNFLVGWADDSKTPTNCWVVSHSREKKKEKASRKAPVDPNELWRVLTQRPRASSQQLHRHQSRDRDPSEASHSTRTPSSRPSIPNSSKNQNAAGRIPPPDGPSMGR